jgi:lipoprotein-releasing system permease protein
MFRPIELFVGLRYTRAKRRNHFISFISLISMLGIALGVTALITVLSVMNGFEKELRERILSMVSHATITGYRGDVSAWEDLRDHALEHERVLGVAPYIQKETMVQGTRVAGAMVRGVIPDLETQVSDVGDHMQYGQLTDLKPGTFNIILGAELAFAVGVHEGDKVTVFAPQVSATPVGAMPRLKRFTVVGAFEIGMYEYDRGLAIMHMDDAATLFRMGETVSGLRLKLDDLFAAKTVAREMVADLPDSYFVSDWTRQHANYFRAVKMEKTVMTVILSLIVAVAAFNIVSTLVMVVTDKESDIAILRTLGSSPASIVGMFMVQGTLIGVIGTLLGAIGGVALALNVETLVSALEQAFSVDFLAADVYYISDLPSELRWRDVFAICGISFVMTALATLYPAWRGARTQPAEALRYE